jgi:hypothetical protein
MFFLLSRFDRFDLHRRGKEELQLLRFRIGTLPTGKKPLRRHWRTFSDRFFGGKTKFSQHQLCGQISD